MLSASKMKIVEELTTAWNREELTWLNGYLSGMLSHERSEPELPARKPLPGKITITYGTESGNSKKLATSFALKAKKMGITTKLVGLDQYRLTDLQKEEYFLTIMSTQGEGDPPAAAKKFYDHIHNNGFRLQGLKFGVLALGDTSYPLFCKAGEDVDEQLHKLGGQRIVPLQKCDTDFEAAAESWFEQVLQQLAPAPPKQNPSVKPVPVKPSGKVIHKGTVLQKVNLNDLGSKKETYHLEVGAEGVDYLPGDALGVIPENPSNLVQAILQHAGIDPSARYTFRQETCSAIELLKKKLNIVFLPERVVRQYASMVGQDIPLSRIGLLELLRIYPLKNSGQFGELLGFMEPITPRLYSISSSPEAHPGEVHITVAKDRFQLGDECRYGLCSDYLSQLEPDSTFDFYIHRNNQFRLPEGDQDLIMIGPGTGIAPFRSFLAHRDATGSAGRNWLFFGEQHFVTDFLYQSEIQNWLQTGVLTKVDVAFSRDRQEKLYVQHKMLKQGAELYKWLQNGATVYVCGRKDPMSMDVENTLVHIAETQGKKNREEALAFLERLREEGRYRKDVY